MENIQEIANKLKDIPNNKEVFQFLTEILTESELETLSKRWRILKMLKEGRTQRDTAKELNVSSVLSLQLPHFSLLIMLG